jgi:hypothetical protein
MNMSTRTVVTLQIEVHDGQAYSDLSPAGEIKKSAAERALHQIACLNRDGLRVVGEPRVTMVITEDSK